VSGGPQVDRFVQSQGSLMSLFRLWMIL